MSSGVSFIWSRPFFYYIQSCSMNSIVDRLNQRDVQLISSYSIFLSLIWQSVYRKTTMTCDFLILFNIYTESSLWPWKTWCYQAITKENYYLHFCQNESVIVHSLKRSLVKLFTSDMQCKFATNVILTFRWY